MAYIIISRDKPDRSHLRGEVRPAHLEYLSANKEMLLAGGGIIDDDGGGGHGSVLIVDTDDRGEAEAFAANDPFTKSGLFESVVVTRWRKAFFNFEKLV